MPVDFNRIPPNLRVPLFWAEFDATQAGYLATAAPSCLLGHKLSTAPAPTDTPILVSGSDQAAALFGAGSMLFDMVEAYRLNDPTGELWCVAVPEPAVDTGPSFLVLWATDDGTAGHAQFLRLTPTDDPTLGASTVRVESNVITIQPRGAAWQTYDVASYANDAAFLAAINADGACTASWYTSPIYGWPLTFDELVETPFPTSAGGGGAASGSIDFAGTPTASGTIAVYVGTDRYPVAVVPTSTPTTLGAALVAAIAADPFAAVTASAAAGVVTITSRTVGEVANDLALGLNLRGIRANEYTPAGLTVTVTPFAGGAGVPDVTASLAALADAEYDYVGVGWSDAATLDAVADAFNDVTGRWSWSVQLYGHAFVAQSGAVADLVTYGKTRNDPHTTLMGYPEGSPSPSWRVAAALTAEAAVGLRADPARPLQTLPLVGIMLAPRGSRFTVGDRQSSLYAGVATCAASIDDSVHIERAITTYQRNAYGQADPSWLDVQTPATLQYLVRALRNAILTKFPRHKLANDGTRFGAGQAIVTPKIIKAELVAQYSALEEQGLVENMEAFKTFLIVERDPVDPNRVNVLLPPDLVNQLRIFAMLVQFRLQYSSQALTSAAA